jgi:hypothetical protein
VEWPRDGTTAGFRSGVVSWPLSWEAGGGRAASPPGSAPTCVAPVRQPRWRSRIARFRYCWTGACANVTTASATAVQPKCMSEIGVARSITPTPEAKVGVRPPPASRASLRTCPSDGEAHVFWSSATSRLAGRSITTQTAWRLSGWRPMISRGSRDGNTSSAAPLGNSPDRRAGVDGFGIDMGSATALTGATSTT